MSAKTRVGHVHAVAKQRLEQQVLDAVIDQVDEAEWAAVTDAPEGPITLPPTVQAVVKRFLALPGAVEFARQAGERVVMGGKLGGASDGEVMAMLLLRLAEDGGLAEVSRVTS